MLRSVAVKLETFVIRVHVLAFQVRIFYLNPVWVSWVFRTLVDHTLSVDI